MLGLEVFGEDTRGDVHRSAGAKRDDDGDRTVRIGCGGVGRAGEEQGTGKQGTGQNLLHDGFLEA